MIAKKYRLLLVDADDTILDFKRCEHDALRTVLQNFGLPDGDEVIAVYSGINDRMWKMLEKMEITKSELRVRRFREFLEKMGYSADAEAVASAYEQALGTKHYLLPGAAEACQALSGHIPMYIITNGLGYAQKRRLAESGITSWVDGVFISGQIGAEKPSKAFFDAVEARLGALDRDTTLVIGDSLTSDIAGAVNAGFDSLWITRGKPAPDVTPYTYCLSSFAEVPAFLGIGGEENAK